MIHTSILGDSHAYTRSRTPWILANCDASCKRLTRYLSGGGLKAFGRTVRQEEIRHRHFRFWSVFAVLAALWAVFLVF